MNLAHGVWPASGGMGGRFITFEGGEGTGKSTQAALLARRLGTFGLDVVLTREPGGSPGAEIIRRVLLSGAAKALGPDAEALLFAAARADHVDTVIRPALAAGKWVVSDRFIDSTRVYQGVLGRVAPAFLRGLERVTVGATVPDLTLILDLPAEIGLARADARRGGDAPDRFENETFDYHRRLNAAFREIAAQEPRRCVLVDADRSEDLVAADIWRQIEQRLRPQAAPLTIEDFAT